MIYDIATICTSKRTQERATLLGFAVMVLLQSRKYSIYQILTIRHWIEQAVDLGQIKFVFDWDGSPIGYMTWGYLAEDVEVRLIKDSDFLLHFSEWNEGSNLWVIDLCMPTGSVKEALRDFVKEMTVSNIRLVSWVRRHADNRVKKICRYSLIEKAYTAKILS